MGECGVSGYAWWGSAQSLVMHDGRVCRIWLCMMGEGAESGYAWWVNAQSLVMHDGQWAGSGYACWVSTKSLDIHVRRDRRVGLNRASAHSLLYNIVQCTQFGYLIQTSARITDYNSESHELPLKFCRILCRYSDVKNRTTIQPWNLPSSKKGSSRAQNDFKNRISWRIRNQIWKGFRFWIGD